jgi:Spy/CpxP family protein refolding chaperone
MLRIHTIALGLALCAGVAVAAGAQATDTPQKSDTTATARRAHKHQTRRAGMERGERGLFKGIDLSSAQHARIDSIRAKYRGESKSLRDQMTSAMKDVRAARQSGDSAKVQAARQSMSEPRQKMQALHQQELGEIRGVLTPAQQATFDKNVTSTRSRLRERPGQRRGDRSGGSHGA